MGNKQDRTEKKPLIPTFYTELIRDRGPILHLKDAKQVVRWTLKLDYPIELRKYDDDGPNKVFSVKAKLVKDKPKKFLLRGKMNDGICFGVLVRKAECPYDLAHFIFYFGYDECDDMRYFGDIYHID